MRVVITVLFTLGCTMAFARETSNYFDENWIYREAYKFLEECSSGNYIICLKERSLRYLNNLPNSIDLGGGLRIKQADGNRTSRQHASVVLPDEPKAREEALDKALLEKLTDYMGSHSFEYKIPTDSINDLEKSIEEGRKRKGGGGGGMRMKPLMMLLQIKAAILAAIALKFIALVAFKALLVAKIALTISGMVALKKLVEQKSHSPTYEVYAHPHYDEHSHFDRAFNPDLAYRGQTGVARSSN